MDYDSWIALVNEMFFGTFGVYSNTFEDWMWREAFDLGRTPGQAFEEWAEETSHAYLI